MINVENPRFSGNFLLATIVYLLGWVVCVAGQANPIYCDSAQTLQLCVDMATAVGTRPGTAVLPANRKFELRSPVYLYSNTTLLCEPGSLIEQSAGVNLLSMLQNKHARSATGPSDSNLTVEGCSIDGNRGNNSGPTQGISLYAQPGFRVKNIVIRNSTIRNTSSEGIYGFGWENVEIAHSYFVNDAGGAGNLNDGALYVVSTNGGSSRISVHDNICDASSSRTGCFKFSASEKQKIENLAVYSNKATVGDGGPVDTLGIELFGSGLPTSIQHFVVKENVVSGPNTTNTSVFGISIGGASYGSVAGNRITDTNAIGIETIGSYVTVIHNILNRTGPIDWDGSPSTQTNVIIARNITTGPVCRGIFLYVANLHYLRSGSVADNVIRGPLRHCTNGRDDPPAGLRIQGEENAVANVTIKSNIFQGIAESSAVQVVGGVLIEIEKSRFEKK